MSIESFSEAPKIEIESLALQSSNKSRPHEVLYPPSVTGKMLENASICLESLEKEFPNNPLGLSLHTGMVVDLGSLEDADVPITSIDSPEATTVYGGFFNKIKMFKIKPNEILNRVGYAINCNLGLTKKSAERNRIKKIEEFSDLEREEFSGEPFVRVAYTTPEETDRFLRDIPRHWKVALEYGTESNITLEQYTNYIQDRVERYPNIGMSVDLTHFLEYYLFMEGIKSKETALTESINKFQRILQENPKYVLSVDINNTSPNISNIGQTHRYVLEGGG